MPLTNTTKYILYSTLGIIAIIGFGFLVSVNKVSAAGIWDNKFVISCDPQELSDSSSTVYMTQEPMLEQATYQLSDNPKCSILGGYIKNYGATTTYDAASELTNANISYNQCALFYGYIGNSVLVDNGIQTYCFSTTNIALTGERTWNFASGTGHYFFAFWQYEPPNFVGPYTITSSNPYYEYFTNGTTLTSTTYGTFQFYKGNPYSSSSINILFPYDNVETPDFTSWSYEASNLTPLTTYWLTINAYLASTTSPSSSEIGRQFTNTIAFTTAAQQTYTHSLFYKQGDLVFTPDAVRSWQITARLCADAYCQTVLGEDIHNIKTSFAYSVPDNQYATNDWSGPFDTADNYYYDQNGERIAPADVAFNLALLSDCPSPGDWTDIGGGLTYAGCSLLKLLFVPPSSTQVNFVKNITPFTQLYPLKYFFDFKKAVEAADLNEYSSNTLSINMATAFSPYSSSTSNITLLSPNTLTNLFGQETKDQIFDTQKYILWFIALLSAFKLFI